MNPITISRMMDLSIQLNGKYVNVDGAFGNQCWDSAARVAQLLGLPVVHTTGKGRWYGWAGNMWDAFPQTAAIDLAYVRVGPEQAGQPGDTAIWGDSNPYYPATHVANVVRDFGSQLLCLSQNSSAARPDLPGYSPQSSGPTILQHLPKRGLLGYLRPRTGINPQGTTTQKEWDEMASKDEIKDAIREVAKEGPAGRDLGYYNWFETALPGWNGSVSAAARVAGTDRGVNDILAQMVALRELVDQLAVKQGVVIDYDAIAKAVNDDAAKRMVK